MKRTLSIILSLLMVVISFPIVSVATSAAQTDDAYVTSDENAMTMAANDSLGALFLDEYNESVDAEDFEPGNRIFDIQVENSIAYASFMALEDADLVVSVFDENGEYMYTSGIAEVNPEERVIAVSLDSSKMPKYYLLKAMLLERDTYVPLCEQFECDTYTQVMQEFLAKTVDDFDSEKVLNLDNEEDNNFMVYNDETIIIDENTSANEVTYANDQDQKYVIENINDDIRNLVTGDIFSYCYDGENVLIIKVDSIEINGDTATIYGAEIALEDAFDYIKLDVSQGADQAQIDTSNLEEGVVCEGVDDSETIASTSKPLVNDESVKSLSINYTLDKKLGPCSISGSVGCKLEVGVKCYYDVKLFADDDIEFSFYVKYDISVSAKFELATDDDTKFSIPLGYYGFAVVPGVYVEFTPSFVVEGKISASLNGHLTGKAGKKLHNGNWSDESEPSRFTASFEVEAEVFIGLSLEPKIKILVNVISAEAEIKAGIVASAKLAYTADSYVGDEKHNCRSCIEGELFGKIGITFKLVLLGNDNWSFEAEALNLESKITDFYFSFDTKKYEFSQCPNKSYLQTITIVDSSYKPISGVDVNGEKTDSSGIVKLYLPIGNKEVKLVKSGYPNQSEFINVNGAQARTIVYYKEGETKKSVSIGTIAKTNRDFSLYDVFKYDGHYYKLFDTLFDTWEEAKDYCEKLGGHLTTISNTRENKAIYQYVTESGYKNVYFGYTDSDGAWDWVTDENISYTNWADGEPNNEMGGEDYAMFYWKFEDGTWNDGNFGHGTDLDQQVFLCEWENEVEYKNGLSILLKDSAATSSKNDIASTSADFGENYVLRSGLCPDTQASLIIVEGTSDDYAITSSSILYTGQTTVAANGVANFTYFDNFSDKDWVALVFGECDHVNCNWETVKVRNILEGGIDVYQCVDCEEILDILTTDPIVIEKNEGEVQVFFVNKEGWQGASIFHWGVEEMEWPGEKMIFTGLYQDGYEIYTAVVPENVTGIVFSGDEGDSQTVDILTDIVDNKMWTPTTESFQEYTYKWDVESSDFVNGQDDLILGDVDGDGKISIVDATYIQIHLARIMDLTEEQIAVSDTDRDGSISIVDATRIQLLVARIISSL